MLSRAACVLLVLLVLAAPLLAAAETCGQCCDHSSNDGCSGCNCSGGVGRHAQESRGTRTGVSTSLRSADSRALGACYVRRFQSANLARLAGWLVALIVLASICCCCCCMLLTARLMALLDTHRRRAHGPCRVPRCGWRLTSLFLLCCAICSADPSTAARCTRRDPCSHNRRKRLQSARKAGQFMSGRIWRFQTDDPSCSVTQLTA